MDNYKKGNAVDLDNPIHSLQLDDNCIHMNVKMGSKVKNLTDYAVNNFQKNEINQITWNGSGDALSKVIACAEIMKKKYPRAYQINKIGYKKQEDNWEPTIEGLRKIKVIKEIPSICIILSKKQLDANEPGYQDENSIKANIFNTKTNEANSNTGNRGNSKKSFNENADDDDSIYIRKRSNKDPHNSSNKKSTNVNTQSALNKK